MDYARLMIYGVGAFFLLLFVWASLRKGDRSEEVLLPSENSDLHHSVSQEEQPNILQQEASNLAIEQELPSVSIVSSQPQPQTRSWSRVVQREKHTQPSQQEHHVLPSLYHADLLVMNIMAPPGSVFFGTELVQVFQSQGFFYLEGLFCYSDTPHRINFKISSAIGNGLFPLDHLEQFETTGVTCFMELGQIPDPKRAFRKMLTSVHELSYILGGQLKDETGQPLLQQSVTRYLERIKTKEAIRETADA